MKKKKLKIKNIFKNKTLLIGIVIGLTLGISGVALATTLLYSKDVTYDNTASGLSSTNLQDALDELYEQAKNNTKCPKGYVCNILPVIENVPVVTTGDGLYMDSIEGGRYIYKGANPNNYITFNSETWRIIAIENDGSLKLIKQTSIINTNWDSSNNRTADSNGYCSYSSCSSWGSKTTTLNELGSNVTTMPRYIGATAGTLPSNESSLNTYLNSTYYDSLTNESKAKIINHNFSIGVVDTNTKEQTTITDVYYEQYYKWNGKIALANATDYVRASTSSAISSCTGVHAYKNSNSSGCYNNELTYNWMDNGSSWWTLTPSANSSSYFVWYVVAQKGLSAQVTYTSSGVRPVVFLSSDITLSGSGTSSDPYVITR